MKNLKNVLTILFVSVIMCGCSGNSVVGTWKLDMEASQKRFDAKKSEFKHELLEGTEAEWVFNEDGTGTEKGVIKTETIVEKGVKYKTTINSVHTFNWHKDGSRLVVEITDVDMTWDTEAICDNPRERAQWQKNAKKMSKEMTENMRLTRGKEMVIADCNSNGSYDFEILELNENRLEMKSAKGDIKELNRVKQGKLKDRNKF